MSLSAQPAEPATQPTRTELLLQVLENSTERQKVVSAEHHRQLVQIQTDAARKLEAIFAERLPPAEHRTRIAALEVEKNQLIAESNDWYRESMKAIELDQQKARNDIIARFASGEPIVSIGIDTETNEETVPLSGDAQQDPPAAGPIGATSALPDSPLTPESDARDLPMSDIAVTGIAYEYGGGLQGLPTGANQAPPSDQDRIIRVRRCETPVRFSVSYATRGTARESLGFDLTLSLSGRVAASWRASQPNNSSSSNDARIAVSPGNYVVQAMADGANEVLESDETNNRLFARIVVEPYPGLSLDCGTQPSAATNSLTDPRAQGRAADLSGAVASTPASAPDDAVLSDALTQPDLVVTLSQPMGRSITVTNQGHSATTETASINLSCEATSGGPCPPDLAISPASIPPLSIDETHTHTVRGWPRQWDWPRGTFQFTVSINEDGAVTEAPGGNTGTSTKAWNPSMAEVLEHCLSCHIPDDSGQGPSPDDLVGRADERGFPSLVDAAIGGVRFMPARGGIEWLTDAEVTQAVRNLVDLGDPSPLSADGFYSGHLATRPRSSAQDDALEAARNTPATTAPRTPPLDTETPPESPNATAPRPDGLETSPAAASVVENAAPEALRASGTETLRTHGSTIGQQHVSHYNELLANIDRAREERERRERPRSSGYGVFGTDCDDTDPAVHPGAAELACDTIDNDCDGEVNEGAPLHYLDADEDGWGDGSRPPVHHCAAIGFANRQGDCDDGNFDIRPDALEVPGNQIDENCNGSLEN